MKCPYCHADMELGYIQCRDGISWSKEKRAIAALKLLNTSKNPSIRLATSAGPFAGAAVEAYVCRDCKKIMIDYSDIHF